MQKNLVEKSYNLISDMIFRYQLAPGAKVSDYVLSKSLGISRTPIRSAMQMLLADELLVSEGSHFKVPEITVRRVDEVYDARLSIQTGLIRIAMKNGIEPSDICELRREIDAEEECFARGDIYSSIEHDLKFNRKLSIMCGNPFLIKYYIRLEKQTRLLSLFAFALPDFNATEFYRHICDCMMENNEEGACEAMEKHIEVARNQKKQILESYKDKAMEGIYSLIAKSIN